MKPDTVKKKEAPEKGVYKRAFQEYKEKMKTDFHPGEILNSNKFWIVLIIILLFAFVGANSRINTTAARLRIQMQSVTRQVNNLEGAIAEEQERLAEEERLQQEIDLTPEEEETAVNDAKTQGSMTAYLQNQYAVYSAEYEEALGALEEGDAEGQAAAMQAYRKQIEANQAELEGYFDNAGQTNGLTSWSSILGTTIPGTWEFATNAAFEGDTAEVLWLCYADDPEDHSLLGYCTAEYSASTGLFTHVDVQTTKYAQEHAANDSEDPNADERPLVEQINELTGEDWVADTSGEFDEETLEENASLSDTRESYKEAVKNGETGEGYDPNYDIGLGGEETAEEETVLENMETAAE